MLEVETPNGPERTAWLHNGAEKAAHEKPGNWD